MKKLFLICTVLTFVFVNAQNSVTGVVQDEEGFGLPGATIINQDNGETAVSDFDGNFSILANDGNTLSVSFVGYAVKDVEAISGGMVIQLDSDNLLDEIVVTSLGITREKKSLGYAVQTVGGDEVSDVRSMNPIEALQGEVAGLDVQSFNTMGGSANVVIRGYSSLSGSNQALFVVDGTPIDNTTGNSLSMQTGRGGVDFGNAAMDINPSDIASVSVLKGAAASAL